MPVDLMFIRTKEGAMNRSGLLLVPCTTDDQLSEIMQMHRGHSAFIADPRVYGVEYEKPVQAYPEVAVFGTPLDPLCLLNPGRLRGRRRRERIMVDAASGEVRWTMLSRE